MDANVKKALLAARGKDEAVAAATVNWVTQASFAPPLVAVGVKADSHAHPLIKDSKAFALNVLDKDQIECWLVDSVERGDHSIFVGEVVEAALAKQPEGRADDATLWLKDLGPNVFYGG